MRFMVGVVEVGSTNTKAYHVSDNSIEESGFKTIEFKTNYKTNGYICNKDIDSLASFIKNSFERNERIYVYATSIFREITYEEVDIVTNLLRQKVDIEEFNIVSAEQENEYTVLGSISDIHYSENICVFVGGGGSTEISTCYKGQIVEMANSSFGVSDVMHIYPDLKSDHTNLDIDDISRFVGSKLKMPDKQSKILIMSGGDFLLRYYNAGYPVQENQYFKSDSHPVYISYEANRKFEDEYFHNISLEALKDTTPGNRNWWNGTRAMCAITDAVACSVGAQILIPTKISMIYGIATLIRDKIV